MKKRVLILSTSPRQGSNSDALAASFAEGARSAGHTVSHCSLRDKSLHFFSIDRNIPDVVFTRLERVIVVGTYHVRIHNQRCQQPI